MNPRAKKRWKGPGHFRQKVVCAALTKTFIRISDIRSDDEQPGLRDSEVAFLQMVSKMSTGCELYISPSGSEMSYKPGVLEGGKVVHDCGTERSLGYFIEGIIGLAPFCKTPIHLKLYGITNDEKDMSVDTIRTVTLPLLTLFGIEEGLELKIKKRGCLPNGGGEVTFKCPTVKQLTPVKLEDPGKVLKIRGVAYTARVSATLANRVWQPAKEILSEYTPNVFIYTDNYSGDKAGASPGFGLTLVAESTTGCIISAETSANPGEAAEEVGKRATKLLLEEVMKGGCVDTSNQSLACLLMVLCPEDVSRIRVGRLSTYTVQYLRNLKEFFGITFKFDPDPETKTVLLTCMGTGYVNLNKRIR